MSETILVADANTQFLDQTRYILEKHGYNFLQAHNGEEAKLKLELDQVDVFLVNLSLPSASGYSLCQFVKQELQKPIATALMVSQGHPPPAHEVLEWSDSLLMRPLRPKELLGTLRSLLTIRTLMMQNLELRRRIETGEPIGSSPMYPQPTAPPVVPVSAPAPAPAANVPPPDETESPLYPMNWFRKLAALEVKRAIRFRQPLSLLLLSYDLTEEFLASHSEHVLEHLAEKLADAVRRSIRDIDIPVQFSRDHILMLLPNTGIEGAIQGASRIKEAISILLAQEISPEYGPPTISIGATTSSTQGTFKFTDLLRDATRALREVRSQGGDSVFYC